SHVHGHGMAVKCTEGDVGELSTRRLTGDELEELPDRRLRAYGIVVRITSRPVMSVDAVASDGGSSLKIVVEREPLHSLEDYPLGIARVTGRQLCLIQREGPVHAEVGHARIG